MAMPGYKLRLSDSWAHNLNQYQQQLAQRQKTLGIEYILAVLLVHLANLSWELVIGET